MKNYRIAIFALFTLFSLSNCREQDIQIFALDRKEISSFLSDYMISNPPEKFDQTSIEKFINSVNNRFILNYSIEDIRLDDDYISFLVDNKLTALSINNSPESFNIKSYEDIEGYYYLESLYNHTVQNQAVDQLGIFEQKVINDINLDEEIATNILGLIHAKYILYANSFTTSIQCNENPGYQYCESECNRTKESSLLTAYLSLLGGTAGSINRMRSSSGDGILNFLTTIGSAIAAQLIIQSNYDACKGRCIKEYPCE